MADQVQDPFLTSSDPFLNMGSIGGTALSHAEDHAIEFTKEFLSKIIATNLFVKLHSIALKVKDGNLIVSIKYDKSIYEEIILTGVTDASRYDASFVQGHFVITDSIYAWAQICGYSVSNGYIKIMYPKGLEGVSMQTQMDPTFT